MQVTLEKIFNEEAKEIIKNKCTKIDNIVYMRKKVHIIYIADDKETLDCYIKNYTIPSEFDMVVKQPVEFSLK